MPPSGGKVTTSRGENNDILWRAGDPNWPAEVVDFPFVAKSPGGYKWPQGKIRRLTIATTDITDETLAFSAVHFVLIGKFRARSRISKQCLQCGFPRQACSANLETRASAPRRWSAMTRFSGICEICTRNELRRRRSSASSNWRINVKSCQATPDDASGSIVEKGGREGGLVAVLQRDQFFIQRED